MSTKMEIKLLTLLNVSAVKKPRELDVPGGHRGSPSVSVTVSEDGTQMQEGSTTKKRRKSVVFGGEMGPSGSGFGKKQKQDDKNGNGKGKGKASAEQGVNGVKSNGGTTINGGADAGLDEIVVEDGESGDEGEASSSANADLFNVHFGVSPPILSSDSVTAAESNQWKAERKTLKGFGRAVELSAGLTGSTASSSSDDIKTRMTPALLSSLKASSSTSPLVSTSLAHLGTYKDFYLHSLDGEADGSETQLLGEQKEAMRKAATVHALNHVLKTRRRIIRNNEKLAHAAAAEKPTSVPEPPRDQSFTRPKVLFLLPLRSIALHYLKTHLFPLAPAGTQIENQRPFNSSFSLPDDESDPLTAPSALENFPIDHLVNFRGNSDDNFRIGIKITRKAWRVVMMPANEQKLLECDILIASPLGFKMAAEREDSTDLLSSIEVCVVDGVDVMQMQNWEHVQFIFNNMNKIPKSPHGCDFSRVKPWYLESQAQYLRQTILLSRYDTPEGRALFHRQCHNLQGKVRLEKADFGGVLDRVKPGVRQVFERFDLEGPKGMGGDAAVEEVDARLEWFTKKTIPALLRSAVSRQNTLIVVPSYFDFVRVTNHLRKTDQVTFAAISEYSSNAEISRARTLFFKGKKAFLLVTERFHFYRRYKIRGAKTIVFYSLPEHVQFYSEFMQTPFLPSKNAQGVLEAEVDEGEVSGKTLFSRFDALKLERVVGTENARRLLKSEESRFEFV
ncbi:hypothetical protein CI109_103616 [Kwoniella shandongensis]|uniref:U3 small nucleolar RNA-associated protein 25 n=1 Tax=Kwoniella shandongensis TaxID=1734106 RepID=A0A5M6C933_9TREE|nr:uncharacterized protein CI109_000692 [Kwoniella shandongensis]KAA5531120.1 hypothetical protein CI109_000692 [Kwoniella shandongensis]